MFAGTILMSQGIAVTNVSNISILGLVWSGKMLAVGLRFRMWFTALRKYSHYVKASTDLSSLGISFSRTIRLRTSAKENFIVGTKSAKGLIDKTKCGSSIGQISSISKSSALTWRSLFASSKTESQESRVSS
jgi:hypothetical protein